MTDIDKAIDCAINDYADAVDAHVRCMGLGDADSVARREERNAARSALESAITTHCAEAVRREREAIARRFDDMAEGARREADACAKRNVFGDADRAKRLTSEAKVLANYARGIRRGGTAPSGREGSA